MSKIGYNKEPRRSQSSSSLSKALRAGLVNGIGYR